MWQCFRFCFRESVLCDHFPRTCEATYCCSRAQWSGTWTFPVLRSRRTLRSLFFSFRSTSAFFRPFFERGVDVTVPQNLCETIGPSLRTSCVAHLRHAFCGGFRCPSRWQVPLPPPGANVGSVWCSTLRVPFRPGRGIHHLILWDASVKGVFFSMCRYPFGEARSS